MKLKIIFTNGKEIQMDVGSYDGNRTLWNLRDEDGNAIGFAHYRDVAYIGEIPQKENNTHKCGECKYCYELQSLGYDFEDGVACMAYIAPIVAISRDTEACEYFEIQEREEDMENNKWIPVVEQVPDCTGDYLVTYTRELCANEMAVAFFSREDYDCNDPQPWECCALGDVQEIIAWMPLPEVYNDPAADEAETAEYSAAEVNHLISQLCDKITEEIINGTEIVPIGKKDHGFYVNRNKALKIIKKHRSNSRMKRK